MESGFGKRVISFLAAVAFVIGLVFLLPARVDAIPAFSRLYGTSCSTCHVNFPKLNDFGKAFKDAGFKFPKDDETFLKVQPVMLGSPAQKELWPKTIWPGTIPGLPPIGLRYNQFFQYVSANRNNLNPVGPDSPVIPRTDFQPGLFSIFTAGNFGSGIAFWVDDDISVAGANANGFLGDGYLKFVNIGRFMKLPTDSLSLRTGQFELDLPFTQARTYNLSNYDIYQEANIGSMNSIFGQQNVNVNNNFTVTAPAQGVEFSGGHNYGGYHYSVAIVNQNTTTTTAAVNPVSAQTAFVSDANFKDIYARLAYRFNLERNAKSRNDVQAAGPTGPRDHTSIRVGSFYYYGRSVQRFNGAVDVLTAREPFYRVGGDLDFHYRTFNIYGLYMYGHDHNLAFVPADAELPTGFASGPAATFSGGFIQADYMPLPWLMMTMRWDTVNSKADKINSLAGAPTNYIAPFDARRNRFTPGVQFLIHANIKASFEYQIRPRQAMIVTDPVTSLPEVTNPFRTNTAVAGLEFVY